MQADDTKTAISKEDASNEIRAKVNNLTSAAHELYRKATDAPEFIKGVKALLMEAVEIGASYARRVPQAGEAPPPNTTRKPAGIRADAAKAAAAAAAPSEEDAKAATAAL